MNFTIKIPESCYNLWVKLIFFNMKRTFYCILIVFHYIHYKLGIINQVSHSRQKSHLRRVLKAERKPPLRGQPHPPSLAGRRPGFSWQRQGAKGSFGAGQTQPDLDIEIESFLDPPLGDAAGKCHLGCSEGGRWRVKSQLWGLLCSFTAVSLCLLMVWWIRFCPKPKGYRNRWDL